MPGDEERGLGDVAPRKKKGGFITYLIIGIICVIAIGGVTLWGGGNDKNGSPNGISPSPTVPVTIAELQAQIITTNANITALRATVAGITGPTVTQEDIAGLQTTIDSLTADVANWTEVLEALEGNTTSTINVTGGSTYWLTGSDDDIRLHILSAKDMRFVAEVTVSYDDSILFANTTYDVALADFYNVTGTDEDYIPNLIPYNTIIHTTNYTVGINLSMTNYNNTYPGNTTGGWYNFTIPITTILSDWEYTTVTFHTDSFEVTANEEKSGWIDGLNELGDYDTISIRLFPSLEASETGDGDWF